MECDEMATTTCKQHFEEVCPWKRLRKSQEVKRMKGWWESKWMILMQTLIHNVWMLMRKISYKRKKTLKLTRGEQIEVQY